MNRAPSEAIGETLRPPEHDRPSTFSTAQSHEVLDHFVGQADGVVVPIYSLIFGGSAGTTVVFAMVAIRMGA